MGPIRRAIAPPLGAVSGDTITRFFELTALHLRQTIPSLSALTLDDFMLALADLRPQQELLDDHDDDEED